MGQGRRRHVRPASRQLREVVAWGLVGLLATAGLLVRLGVAWQQTVAGCAGLLLIVLLAYVLNRTGLMRLTDLDVPEPSGGGDSEKPTPPAEQ